MLLNQLKKLTSFPKIILNLKFLLLGESIQKNNEKIHCI